MRKRPAAAAVRIAAAASAFAVTLAAPSRRADAEEPGRAGGKGTIERLTAGESERVEFAPRFSFAYSEGEGAKRSTWIVLTDKEPPARLLSASGDRAEARRVWCGKERAPFVALKLDADWKVDLYFLCPANGGVNTEMLSTMNGLDSIVVTFEVRDGGRLKGTLRTGTGSCPGPGGAATYCTATGDYTFDTALAGAPRPAGSNGAPADRPAR